METRAYRGTDDRVSLLGFGAMRLPRVSPDTQEIDFERARELIDCAYTHGVNYFDTAYRYHDGDSEPFLGRALAEYPRESYHLASKMPTWLVHSLDEGKRIFADQLERCRTDYFDFYLCHSVGKSVEEFTDVYEKTGLLDHLRAQKAAGAIRRLGFSFHGTPEVLRELIARGGWDFVQIQLNYLDWELLDAARQYRILEENGLPCIVMEPVRGGNLVSLCPEAVEILRAARPGASTASWAIRFAASLPNVLTVLSGMSTLEQVRDNVETMSPFEPLSDSERETLDRARRAYFALGTIPCTGCRYCMDCPSGVDIPGVFAAYNRCAAEVGLDPSDGRALRENAKAIRAIYDALPEERRAGRCVGCGRCVSHCPQGIAIPQRLGEIAALLKILE